MPHLKGNSENTKLVMKTCLRVSGISIVETHANWIRLP